MARLCLCSRTSRRSGPANINSGWGCSCMEQGGSRLLTEASLHQTMDRVTHGPLAAQQRRGRVSEAFLPHVLRLRSLNVYPMGKHGFPFLLFPKERMSRTPPPPPPPGLCLPPPTGQDKVGEDKCLLVHDLEMGQLHNSPLERRTGVGNEHI